MSPDVRFDLEHLAEEHADLRTMLRNLQTAFGERKASAEELASQLDKARKQLESHFAHEETGGYFQGVLDAAPHLSDRVGALKHEHPQFLSLLDQMRSRVTSHETEEVWRGDCDNLFGQFLKNFLAHEASEHELMQQAYSQDIGNKD